MRGGRTRRPTAQVGLLGRRARRRRDAGLPALIVAVGVAASIVTALLVAAAQRDDATRQFQSFAREARTLLDSHTERYSDLVASLSSSLRANPDRDAFAELVDRVDVDHRLPGALATEYAPAVASAEVPAFEQSTRAEAGPSHPELAAFTVHPANAQAVHFPVTDVTPVAGNEAALGFDLASEPGRLAAIETARDTGEVTATPPLALVQRPADQPGMLLVAPVYDAAARPATVPERRRAFRGVTLAVVDVHAMLDGSLGLRPTVDVDVYDIGTTLAEPAADVQGVLVFDANGVEHGPHAQRGPNRSVLDLDVAGRRWRLVFTPQSSIGPDSSPWLLAFVGILLSALGGAYVWQLLGGRSRRAEAALHSAFEFGPDALVVVDADGVVAFANAKVLEVFGHEPAAIVGQQIEVLVPDRLRGRHHDEVRGYVSAPVARPMGARDDLRGLRADGSEVAIDVRLSPLEVQGTTYFAAAVRDISERRQADAERATLAAIVETADDAVWSTALDGTIQTWNRGAERVFGYTAEEMIGQSADLLVPGERVEEKSFLVAAAISGERMLDVETVRRSKDGALIDVSLTVSPVVDSAGNVLGLSAIARDVTARRAAQEAMAQAFEQERTAMARLRETDRLKDEFLDMTAHELRTPLASIRGFSELLGRTDPPLDDATRAQLIDRLRANSRDMTAMVDRLLDFSRLRAGKVHIELEQLELAPLLGDIIAANEAAMRGRTVEVDLPERCVVLADREAVTHILVNLLGNAAKFSPDDRPIEVRATVAAPDVRLEVSDHGPGVAPGDVPRLFERFFRGRNQPPGARATGVGLSIVARYAELLGGRVWYEAPADGGARFVVTLPLAPAPDEAGRQG